MAFGFDRAIMIVFGVVLVTLPAVAVVMAFRVRDRRRCRLARRQILPMSEWMGRHFGDSLSAEDRQHVEVILGLFASELEVEPTQLHPDDVIDSDYTLPELWTVFEDDHAPWMESLYGYLVEEAHVLPSNDELAMADHWITLRDFIEGMLTMLNRRSEHKNLD